MLVITRKEGQNTVITVPPSSTERTIVVQIVEVKNAIAVRLGIHADRDIDIVRDDVKNPERKDGR